MLPAIHVRHDTSGLLSTLEKYLPLSLPLVRRLQFMNFPGGRTEDSCILTSFEELNVEGTFVVAYLDFSRGPETEMWLCSSLEGANHNPEDVLTGEDQLIALFKRAGEIERTFRHSRSTPGVVLVGSLHEKILTILQQKHITEYISEPYLKFLFEARSFSTSNSLPSDEFFWGSVRPQDLPLVLSRTKIPRKERTLNILPNIAIYTKNNPSPIAWGFLGPDGSLASLHCEAEYRSRGLAKAITSKLFRDYLPKFSLDGLGHADVALDNLQSQGVCKSLGGATGFIVYWARIRTNSFQE